MNPEIQSDNATSLLDVVCAIISNDSGQLLACQRSSRSDLPGKWEFPGGKVEPQESREAAIQREILEELGVKIHQLIPQPSVHHRYHQPDKELNIALHPFQCKLSSDATPQALEHSEIRWVTLSEADHLDWATADILVLEHFKQSFPQDIEK